VENLPRYPGGHDRWKHIDTLFAACDRVLWEKEFARKNDKSKWYKKRGGKFAFVSTKDADNG